ncbi:EAL domain-containing protein [Neptunomonas antarctica]|uniref:PAS domain S-box-containing protein/diguanylate cyclase (GGDEF) domain-containing protein n=1 Tax=Neptunomonas antarctica TaxID=619304 RepID=A0A1N7MUD3_9GAMM|nr:EAL domain-containing protein [Neptunomonas antarctica]SIS89690.1 PAS domain S-box-containing protein/diguanylate cyclase (GGDEF) domain-containing protein [Neptunomonas antarctica]
MNQHTRQLRKIFAFALLLFISGMLTITAYSLWRLRAETVTSMLEMSAMHSRSFESFITQNMRLVELTTFNVANMDSRNKNYFNIERFFVANLRNNPAQRSISLLDEQGRIIVSSNRANEGIIVNTDEYLPVQTQTQTKSILRIGRPWAGRDFISGRPTTHQTPINAVQSNFIPVIHTLSFGQRKVTLLTAFNPDYFINHISQILKTEEGVVDIVRYDGTLLLSTDLTELAGSLDPYNEPDLNLNSLETGQFLQKNHNGRSVFTSFRTSQLYPFIVFTRIDRQHAMQNWKTEAKILIGVIIATLIALTLLVNAFYRRQVQLEAERIESEKLQRINATVFGSSADSIIITDIYANIISVNPAFCEITGYTAEEAIGQNPRFLASGKQDENFYKAMWASLRSQGFWCGEIINRCKNGHLYDAHTTISAFRDTEGHLQHFIGVSTDITERKKSDVRLRQAASVFLNSQEGIMVTDAHNLIVDINPAFSHITGYDYQDVIGKNPGILSSGKQSAEFYTEMKASLEAHGSWQGEIWNRKKSGEIFAERLSIDVVSKADGEIDQHVAVFSDISRIKAHETELDRIAHYDALTGIPNRRLLGDRLNHTIARAKRSGKSLAVCYLDLDSFKPVNDQYGHATGDLLLIEVTQRLLKILREEDTIARLGGDEFVILFSELGKPEEIDRLLDRVLTAISMPVLIENHSLHVSASIGVTLFPADTADADTLLRHADQAMYQAKEAGKNRYHLFDPGLDREVQARRTKLKHINVALNKDEFVLYYQPKVDLLTGEVIGAEALIRWQHPEQGLLPPAAFLGLIDGHDLEIEIGEWVIESVLKQIAVWNTLGLTFPVSANLSANHLLQVDFADRLQLMLERHPAVKHEDLELEILETSTLNDIDQAAGILTQCRNMGVRFSLDDFGTGYSSLTYFQRLPVDTLKIDQSFVRDMLEDPNDLDIVESIVRLTQTFNKSVIAEGVETLEHGAMLIKLGCSHAQGYGIARPMPAGKLPAWVEQWRHDEPWLTINIPTEDSKNISLIIAMQNHIKWLDNFVTLLESSSDTPLSNKTSHQCQFGRWYHSSGFARYGTLQEFKDIAPLHDAVHALSDELMVLANDGHRAIACRRLPELYALKDLLLTQIQSLIKALE